MLPDAVVSGNVNNTASSNVITSNSENLFPLPESAVDIAASVPELPISTSGLVHSSEKDDGRVSHSNMVGVSLSLNGVGAVTTDNINHELDFSKIHIEGTLSMIYYNHEEHKCHFNDFLYVSKKQNSVSLTTQEIQTKIETIDNFAKAANEMGQKKSHLVKKDKHVIEDFVVVSIPSNKKEKDKAHYLNLQYPILMRQDAEMKKINSPPLFVIASEHKFEVIEKEMIREKGKILAKKRGKSEVRLNTKSMSMYAVKKELGIWNITQLELDTWLSIFKELTNLTPPHDAHAHITSSINADVVSPMWVILPVSFKDNIQYDAGGCEKDTLVVLHISDKKQILAHPVKLCHHKDMCVLLYHWWNEVQPKPKWIAFPNYYQNLAQEVAQLMAGTPQFPSDLPITSHKDATYDQHVSNLSAEIKSLFIGINWAVQYHQVLANSFITGPYLPVDKMQNPKKRYKPNNTEPDYATPAIPPLPNEQEEEEKIPAIKACPIMTPVLHRQPWATILATMPVQDITMPVCCFSAKTAMEHFCLPGNGAHRDCIDFEEIIANLCCFNCADTEDGIFRSQPCAIHTKAYNDCIRKPNTWFETDFINTYGCFIQHEYHCSRTWFYPWSGDTGDKTNPQLAVEPHRIAGKRVLPHFVDHVIALIFHELHFAVLDIDNIKHTIHVYDGFQHKYGKCVDCWSKHILMIMRCIGWISPDAQEIPMQWFVCPKIVFRQWNQVICGGVACIIIEYLFHHGQVPDSLKSMTSDEIRNHVVSTFEALYQKSSNDLMVFKRTWVLKKACKAKKERDPLFTLLARPMSKLPTSHSSQL